MILTNIMRIPRQIEVFDRRKYTFGKVLEKNRLKFLLFTANESSI